MQITNNVLTGSIFMKKILLMTLSILSGAMGFAGESRALTPYIGLDYMYSDYGFDLGENQDGRWLEHKFNGGAASLGVKLTNNLAFEGFYQLTENGHSYTSNSITAGDRLETKMRLRAYGVDLVRDIVNMDVLEILGSIGVAKYEMDSTRKYTLGGVTEREKINKDFEALRLGVGAQLNITPHYSIRGMFRYSLTNITEIDDIKEFTVGARVYF